MSSLLVRGARRVPIGVDVVPDGPVDVLVEDGTVTAVGRSLDRPTGAEELQADGRWLIPGLWDQHVHLTQWTLASQRLDLASTLSPEEALVRVAEQLALQPGAVVVGWGHRSGHWARESTVAELDAVAGSVPVVLISGDGHNAWCNSAALEALGLPLRDVPVRETEWFAAYPRLPGLVGSEGSSPAAVRLALDEAAAKGIVGLTDFEFGADRSEWTERWSQGCDRLRIRWATYAGTLDAVIDAGLRTGDPLPGCDDRATVGPLKIISDGSLNTRTAWCCDPYADTLGLAHPDGLPNLSGAELRELLRRAHVAGLEVATHAIGDAAVTEALDAYAATGARGSIEHVQLIARTDVARLARLGLRASVQPAHLLDDRDLTEQIWPGRADRCFAFRWLLDADVDLRLGSDAPVSPLDPWLAMAAAVHRSADGREAWHEEQALTPAEALAASVDGQPTVGVGSRGDLALVERDPLATEADSAATAAGLRGTAVALTVAAGQVVHGQL